MRLLYKIIYDLSSIPIYYFIYYLIPKQEGRGKIKGSCREGHRTRVRDRGEREEGIGKTKETERMGDRRKNPACLTFRNLSCNGFSGLGVCPECVCPSSHCCYSDDGGSPGEEFLSADCRSPRADNIMCWWRDPPPPRPARTNCW